MSKKNFLIITLTILIIINSSFITAQSNECTPMREQDCEGGVFNYGSYDYHIYFDYRDKECPFKLDDNNYYLKNSLCGIMSEQVDQYYKYNKFSFISESIQHFKLKNRLFNGDFSQGLAGWDKNSNPESITIVSEDCLFGTTCAKIVSTDNTGTYDGIKATFDVKPNTNYVVSGYMNDNSLNMNIHCYDSSSMINYNSDSYNVEYDWMRRYSEFTTNAFTTHCDVVIFYSPGKTGTFLIDGVMVEESSEMGDFHSGMFSVKYAYDNHNRLITQLNPAGVAESHAFDFQNNDRWISVNNLIPDPSFEMVEDNKLIYWTGNAAMSLDKKSGEKAINASADYSRKETTYFIPVFSGEVYTMAAYAKALSESSTLGFTVELYDENMSRLNPVDFNINYELNTWPNGCGNTCKFKSFTVSSNSYNRVSHSLKVPVNVYYLKVFFGRGGSGSSIIIDDVSLNQGSTAAPFKTLNYDYNPDSTIETIKYDDNLVKVDFTYNDRKWVKSLSAKYIDNRAGPTSIFGEEYEYDEAGNLEKISSSTGYVNLYYDNLDRLKELQDHKYFYNPTFTLQQYTYDKAGNRLTKKSEDPAEQIIIFNYAYIYSDTNVNNKLLNDKVYTYIYDDAGRVKERRFTGSDDEKDYLPADFMYGTLEFEYYASGSLKKVSLKNDASGQYINYYYNPRDGTLAIKETPTNTTYYIVNRFGQLVYEGGEFSRYKEYCSEIKNFNDKGRKLIIKQGNNILAVFDNQGFLKIKGDFIIHSKFNFDRAFSLEDSTGKTVWAIDDEGNLHLNSGIEKLLLNQDTITKSNKNLVFEQNSIIFGLVDETGVFKLKKCIAINQQI